MERPHSRSPQGHQPPHGHYPSHAHHPTRATRANPGLIALAIVGVALFAGLIILIAGKNRRPSSEESSLPPSAQETLDPEAALARDIAALRLLTGPYEERLRRVDMVMPRASKSSDRLAITQIKLQFLIEKEKEDIAALRSLKPSIAALMDKSDFEEALEAIAQFERDHDFILKGAAATVRNLAGEIEALRAEVARTCETAFGKDLALLKNAVQTEDIAAGSEILERILKYGNDQMKAEARAVWDKTDAAFARLRQMELARLTANETRVQAPAAPSSPEAPEPEEPPDIAPDPEPVTPPKDNADDFFGGGGKSAEDVKVFSPVTPNKDGTFTVAIERRKTTLVFASTSLLCIDTAIQPRKYAEHLTPELPALVYCEGKTLNLDQDPVGGRRIFNIDFLMMGDALPDAAAYHDPSPKKKLSTWFKGMFARRAPQLVFRLANQEYIAADEPGIAITRKKIGEHELPRTTFAAFVSGKAAGAGGDGAEKLAVKTLVVLPGSSAANAAIYRALLQE